MACAPARCMICAGLITRKRRAGCSPNAFLAFYKAITGLLLFATHKHFLDGIDHVKFGGTPRATGSGDAQSEGQA